MRLARLLILLLLAGCSGGVLAAPPAGQTLRPQTAALAPADAPRRALFPPTPAGVHLNLVFNYNVHDVRREIGTIDVVWGASAPYPRQVFNQFYTPFEREGNDGPNHPIAWWQHHHPDWIEYRCDRKNVAYEFGEPNSIPLDIANSAFWNYQRTYAVDPAIAAGYNGMSFDNLSLGNYSGRCGHFSLSGKWVAQYSGHTFVDPAYARDVIAWARDTYRYVHALSSKATMAMNYSYQSDFSFAQNYALMTQADQVLDERGYSNWGSAPGVPTPQLWAQITHAIWALQKNGTCYEENGEEPQLSKDITQAERLWVVGNYLLTRDDCTYVWISGFTATGQQDYGKLVLYPEYRLPVADPASAATQIGNGWQREYTRGVVVVNPSLKKATFPLSHVYVDENGNVYSKSIALAPRTAQILTIYFAR